MADEADQAKPEKGTFAPLLRFLPMLWPKGQTELKALFFVRDLAGDPTRRESQKFSADRPALGRKMQVEFPDGETLVGTTQGYQPQRSGFFLVPADSASNNERCFVVSAAALEVKPL